MYMPERFDDGSETDTFSLCLAVMNRQILDIIIMEKYVYRSSMF